MNGKAAEIDIGMGDDLNRVMDRVWIHLRDGATNRRSGFHTPTLATVTMDGRPDVRTVVLRAASPTAGALRFHSDIRSPKISHLYENTACAMHFYSPQDKTQIRVQGEATIHTNDDIAENAWEGSTSFARRCYGQPAGPSSPLDDLDHLVGLDPLDEVTARGNFLAVCVMVKSIDWLWLDHGGHRRARWNLMDGSWHGTWLAP